MSTLETALKRLAEGRFVCEMRYPEEFAVLQEADSRRRADEWLAAIGYRLARLSEDGAFFMAHAVVTPGLRLRLRDELRAVRGKLEPVVGFMETLRQSQGRSPHIHAGDMLWESEISEAVRASPLLERRLLDMREIGGARVSDSAIDRVRRMLAHLQNEGYIVETNPTSKGYQVTGKIDYLYQLIGFIADNTAQLSDDDVVDRIDTQARLDGDAPGQEAPAPAEQSTSKEGSAP
ncbi:hypothetical protein RCH06_002761 [Polaromonas sp. CG_9.5]|uniref:hypothetical protein n=1 Tax=Polaromonas sp. CG_9.5 TaxID=3071705 RepID=UPI002DFDEE57|nr:hypothetical protein [Polaromonas sp. CG_9.5]